MAIKDEIAVLDEINNTPGIIGYKFRQLSIQGAWKMTALVIKSCGTLFSWRSRELILQENEFSI